MKRLACISLFLAAAAFAQRPDGPPPPQDRPDRMPDRAPETCSLATLRGDYIFAQDGTDNGKPFAAAGKETYDGSGHAKGVSTVNANGALKRGAYTATYTMKSDCTGTLTITTADKKVLHYDVYTVPSGDEATWVQTDAGVASAGWQRRRPSRPPMPPRM